MILFNIAFTVNFLIWASAICIADLRDFKIPNKYLVGFIITTFSVLFIPHTSKTHQHMLANGVISAFLLFLIYLLLTLISRGKVGMGDVKLAFVIGFNIGIIKPSAFESSLLFTFVTAGIYALYAKSKGGKLSDSIPFAPFIFIGSALAILLMFASKS